MGTHAELMALGGIHVDLYSLPLLLSGRARESLRWSCRRSYGTAGRPGRDAGLPAVDGGSAFADVAGAEGTGGDDGGRGAENDVLEHVLCLEGGQAAREEVAGEEHQRRHPAQ